MKRSLVLLTALLLTLTALAASGEDTLSFTVFPAELRPYKLERFTFNSPSDAVTDVTLQNADGTLVFNVKTGVKAAAGLNSFTWDGLCDGEPVAAGDYILSAAQGDVSAQTPLKIGAISPSVLSVIPDSLSFTAGEAWGATVKTNMPGTLNMSVHLDSGESVVYTATSESAELRMAWSGDAQGEFLQGGSYILEFVLTDAMGFESGAYLTTVQILDAPAVTASPAPTAAPSAQTHDVFPSLTKGESGTGNYWDTPIGKLDDQLWDILMQPMTVIDGNQKEMYKLRRTPDASTKKDNVVGEITYDSQGVHVLETREDGWTLIEAYNSSYGPDCKTHPGYGNTDELIQGYVKTSLLKTVTPRTDYAMVVDKLLQRLYIYKEGTLFTTLLISTGAPTKAQPWNETPSGEFMIASHMGDFNAGNLVCGMALRVNGGCALHEVPYILQGDGVTRSYATTEPQLGQKASHGCIRVQRLRNSDGISMTWIWNNIKDGTKIIVWDDESRFIEYPDDALKLYYNPDGGKYYHLDQNCSSIRNRYLPLKGEFTYAELDDAKYQNLTPCAACNPPQRKAEIDQTNQNNGF